MELTRETIESIARHSECEVCGNKTCEGDLACMLLAEMDKPKVWMNAPDWAQCAYVFYAEKEEGSAHFVREGVGAYITNIEKKIYRRALPKSRIDEIAEDCWHEINKGITGLPITVIKSAILRALEEKEANR